MSEDAREGERAALRPPRGSEEARPEEDIPAGGPLWQRGFRPFFLGVGIHAAFVVLFWTAVLRGLLPAPDWLAPAWWHGHEMLFGVAAGAIAGFLLTATPVWAGRGALAGPPLMALAALWLAGRLAMLAAGGLPPGLVALVDGAFLPCLALVLARTLWRTGQLRNYGVVALVALLGLANAAVHGQALGLGEELAARALRLGVDVVVVLIVVIGGRITPAFTANALRRLGLAADLRVWPAVDRLAVLGVVLVALGNLLGIPAPGSGLLAALAGGAVALRLAGWQRREAWRDPLVASLHAGMAWVAAGLLLVAAERLGAGIPPAAGLHALAAGAMGAMILAVMTRVALGHTGRPLALPPGAVGCYALVHAGALARVAAVLAPPSLQGPLLLLGGLMWAAAFALFAVVYAPILCAARVDGRSG